MKNISLLVFFIIASCFILVTQYSMAANVSKVKNGDKIILIEPMADGVTYHVKTSYGVEIWKDRDLYYFAGTQESCTVIESYGTEVLLYVPIMDAEYWFTVIETDSK